MRPDIADKLINTVFDRADQIAEKSDRIIENQINRVGGFFEQSHQFILEFHDNLDDFADGIGQVS